MGSDASEDEESRSTTPDNSGEQEMDTSKQEETNHGAEANKETNGKPKSASNSKDPSRPRRKKARRACYACQRAHLTCGDERPCQRCIKRGLQDHCQDGVRKKAKYLHDAPNEALLPGAAYSYTGLRPGQHHPSMNGAYSQPPQAVNYPVYSSSGPSGPSGPLNQPMVETVMTGQPFQNQQSPMATQFANPIPQSNRNMQSLVEAMQQNAPPEVNQMQDPFATNFLDPHDLSQYSFDPASFNFGNHYGALEFGMLDHMASGAAEGDNASQSNPSERGAFATPMTTFADSPGQQAPYNMFKAEQNMPNWRPSSAHQRSQEQFVVGANRGKGSPIGVGPDAFPISAESFASPGEGPQMAIGMDGSASSGTIYANNNNGRHTSQQLAMSQPRLSSANSSNIFAHPRRGKPASSVYETVTQPYSYTSGFHSLTAFLQRRFSPQKTLRIAKALASIRPSFISCTKTLTQDDLVFMEKGFQRALLEYEDYISTSGTPTIVCRRTGEVAAVGKEFSILTGWKKDVLLGKEANLNVNTGGTSGNAGTSNSSRGGTTPRITNAERYENQPARPQPVFLAELLDDDSVVEFYEDFAKLAFGDSRGGVTTRCKLLKYKTKQDSNGESSATGAGSGDSSALKRKRGSRVAGEAGIDELGDKDGKVECSCCWTVKRDLFDLPMMIVMNFLPCI